MNELFAVVAPGLESIAWNEMRVLGLDLRAKVVGGITFHGEFSDIFRSNLYLRTVNRILIRHGQFHAAAFPELRKKTSRLPWEEFISPGQPIAIRATCHKSRLYHSDAVIERVIGGIGDRLGSTPTYHKPKEIEEGDEPHQLVIVRIVDDECMISIDSSGDSLHRRGYRLATAKAPLRETLAASIILASGWNRSDPLLDPFCGSGTIPIEAALLALGIPPGLNRNFAFMLWPSFDNKTWDDLRYSSCPTNPPEIPIIKGSDRDAGAIEMARSNAVRAGVTRVVEFECHSISGIMPPPVPGIIITNPPYGVRVHSNKDLRNLYAQLGNVIRSQCRNWKISILCSDPRLMAQTGLAFESSLKFSNGGIHVALSLGSVP
jgi:putative N6-adenine-specific DNA methylase